MTSARGFFGHLIGLLTPIELFDALGISHAIKQFMAIVVGGIAGAMALVGGAMLLHRRLTDPRVRATSSFADTGILALLLLQLVIGLGTIIVSLDHLDGGTMVRIMNYSRAIFTFQPDAYLQVTGVHWIFKLHIALGLFIFVLFPFTRLVHMLSAPVRYLWRPYQIVRSRRTAERPAGGGRPKAPQPASPVAAVRQETRRMDLAPAPRKLGPGRRETADEALIRAVIEARVEPAAVPGRPAAPGTSPIRSGSALPPSMRPPTSCCLRPRTMLSPRRRPCRRRRFCLPNWRGRPRPSDGLAAAHSACSSCDAGGRLGQIVSGETVAEFETALDSMDVGQISPDPVTTRYGVHIVRLDARAAGGVLPYESVAPRIRELLEKNAWARAAKAFVAHLIAGAEITGANFDAPAESPVR